MRTIFIVLAALQIGVAGACAAADTPTADQAAIASVDSQMVAALNARDLDTWLTFLTDDAQMMPPNAPPVVGKAAIGQMLAGLLASPNFSVTQHPVTITVGSGGDLAYIYSNYEITVPNLAGDSVTERGKEIAIYTKQRDGSWKLVVNIWSPNQSTP